MELYSILVDFSDILMLTQAPILVWFDGTINDISAILLALTMYLVLQCLCFVMIGGSAW